MGLSCAQPTQHITAPGPHARTGYLKVDKSLLAQEADVCLANILTPSQRPGHQWLPQTWVVRVGPMGGGGQRGT